MYPGMAPHRPLPTVTAQVSLTRGALMEQAQAGMGTRPDRCSSRLDVLGHINRSLISLQAGQARDHARRHHREREEYPDIYSIGGHLAIASLLYWRGRPRYLEARAAGRVV